MPFGLTCIIQQAIYCYYPLIFEIKCSKVQDALNPTFLFSYQKNNLIC